MPTQLKRTISICYFFIRNVKLISNFNLCCKDSAICCIPNFECKLNTATSTLKEMNVTHDPLSVHLSVLPHQKLNELEGN